MGGFEFASGMGGWLDLRNEWMGGLQTLITVWGSGLFFFNFFCYAVLAKQKKK
jgi:hypothetical protein